MPTTTPKQAGSGKKKAKTPATDGGPQKKKMKAEADEGSPATGVAPAAAPGAGARGRNYTLSVAVPGSVVTACAGSAVLASAIAGQIARAAVAACVDEVVVYEDDSADGGASVSSASAYLAQALQYMETPPYLRQALCHPTMDAALLAQLQALPQLHAPHHLNQTDWLPFREGIVLKSSAAEPGATHGHAFVDVGLDRMAYVATQLPLHARVTLSVGEHATATFVPEYSETMITAEVVSAIAPRVHQGLYWGFTVRLAPSLHEVVKGCPYKGGYDVTVGTSARGIERGHADLVLPRFSHLLLVLGGATLGLEEIMQQEEALAQKSPEDFFNMYLNVCPSQGGSSIRTEDALLLALGYLRPALLTYGGNV